VSLEHIRVSEKAKDQLARIKRSTGIQHWNVLCRWAFCISIADPSVPTNTKIPGDSSVEMTWKVFGGAYEELYLALLKERCRRYSAISPTPASWYWHPGCGPTFEKHRGPGQASDRDFARSVIRRFDDR
jgi:DNA sulfur modification protein DndE